MTSFIDYLLGAANFMPHGYCLLWRPDLVALHAASDFVIAASYFAIPLGILALGRRRGDFSGGTLVVAGLFVGFIVACGVTHLGGLLTLWWPYYGLEGMAKAATAFVSLATAIIFWQLLPQLVAIPSPSAAEAMNRRLVEEARRREEAYAELERGRAELERIVAERTEELRRAKFLFEAATGGAGIRVAAQDRALRYTFIHDPRLGEEAQEGIGRTDHELLPHGPREIVERHKRRVLDTGAPESFELAVPGGDDTRWYQIDVSPLRAADGAIEGVVSAGVDISRAKRLERLRADLSRKLAAALQRFDLGLRSGNILVFSQDRDLRYVWANTGDTQVGPVVGRTDEELFSPEDGIRIMALKRAALETGVPQSGEVRVEAGGSVRWYELQVEPELGPDGIATGITCACVDVTHRKEHARQLRLVMRELTHRSKNLMSVIQAMARQTARQAHSVAAFHEAFERRLRALAGTQDLLVAENWTTVALDELIRNQVAHYMTDALDRVALDGPPVDLSPEAAQALGLAFHELATNAAKYGALSNDGGRVLVRWSVHPGADGAALDLSWREAGGPPGEPPRHQGFGRIVIERNVSRALGAAVALAFDRAGLEARFRIPVDMIRRRGEGVDDPRFVLGEVS